MEPEGAKRSRPLAEWLPEGMGWGRVIIRRAGLFG